MTIKRAAAALAALTILAGAPALVFAQSAPFDDPVVVSHLGVRPPDTVGNGELTRPGELDLAFRDTSTVAATDVLFEIEGDGTPLGSIREAGTFSPGVTIQRTFRNDSVAANQTATVVRVIFADGSEWFNDTYLDNAFPARMPQRQAVAGERRT